MDISTLNKTLNPKTTDPSIGTVEYLRAPLRPETIYLTPEAQIRPIKPGEIDEALALFLADNNDNPRQINDKMVSFRRLAQKEEYDLSKQIVAFYGNQMVHAALFVPQPGGVAFVFLSPPSFVDGSDINLGDLAARALQVMSLWAFQEGNKLLQVIVDPGDIARQELCRAGGFTLLTDLIYMLHSGRHAPYDKFIINGLDWICYEQDHHELFQKIIKDTYRGSRDCPELENLRDIEDVIRSHQAAGKFDPDLWKLLRRQGKPIGVLLLICLSTPEAMELTYMGLCPEARGESLGEVLVSEALACARRQRRYLTLAVDYRNQYAYHLYQKFGFEEILQRTVLIRTPAG